MPAMSVHSLANEFTRPLGLDSIALVHLSVTSPITADPCCIGVLCDIVNMCVNDMSMRYE